jgi:hypothetical protein
MIYEGVGQYLSYVFQSCTLSIEKQEASATHAYSSVLSSKENKECIDLTHPPYVLHTE